MMSLPATNRWVVRPRPNPDACLRLFCFPYAGGGASIFRSWPVALPPEVDVCAIQLPGRETRLGEPSFTRLSTLVEMLARVLDPYFTTPFAFFGHSLGALIGFELTRWLRASGHHGPLHLFISGHRAPQLPDPNPPIHHLPDVAFVNELRRFEGTPEEVLQNAELMQLLLPILRADFALHETYVYQPATPLNCSISTFGGLQDDEVSQEDLEAWRGQTRRSFKLAMFPGNHFFLHSAQGQLLEGLSQDLSPLLRRIPLYQGF